MRTDLFEFGKNTLIDLFNDGFHVFAAFRSDVDVDTCLTVIMQKHGVPHTKESVTIFKSLSIEQLIELVTILAYYNSIIFLSIKPIKDEHSSQPIPET